MNAPLQPDTRIKPPLHELLLGSLAPEPEHDPGPEARWLLRCRAHGGSDPVAALTAWLQAPPSAASPLLALVSQLQLGVAELIALALACGAETDTMTGRVLAWLQAPLPSARPSVGLVCTLAETLGVQAALSQLLEGKAHHCGVLKLVNQGRPLAETALSVPLPLVLALQSQGQTWPGIDTNAPSLDALSSTCLEEATRQARALGNGAALVVRSTHPLEARTACAALARAAGRRAAFVQGSLPEGFGAWAWLTGSMPVVCAELGPGETLDLSAPRAYDGPLLVATGLEGGVRVDGDADEQLDAGDPIGRRARRIVAAAHRRSAARAHAGRTTPLRQLPHPQAGARRPPSGAACRRRPAVGRARAPSEPRGGRGCARHARAAAAGDHRR